MRKPGPDGAHRGGAILARNGADRATAAFARLDSGKRALPNARTHGAWADTLDRTGEIVLTSDGDGRWTLDGAPAPHLDGLIDVDLEASACTNTLPIHRMTFPVGEVVPAPAVYVRALDLSVTRLEQTYRRIDARRFAYTSEPDFRAVLEYDTDGLIVDYPGVARRFA